MVRLKPIHAPPMPRGVIVALWLPAIWMPHDCWWLAMYVVAWQALPHVLRN